MRRALIGGVLLVLLTGCAARLERVGTYPAQGQSLEQQGLDMSACRDAAQAMAGSQGQETAVGAAGGVVIGATIGAVLGAITGAFFGVPGEAAALGAALGGAGGGIQGAAGGAMTNEQVYRANYKACMESKNYRVGG